MADNDDTYKPASARNASNKELAEQNAALDAEIEKEIEEEHKRKHKKAVKVATQQQESQGPSAMDGFDPLRPFRLAGGFVKGTVMGTLGGVGQGAKYGFYTGAFAGILGCIALGMGAAPMALFVGFIGMSVVGAALGGAIGIATGGIRGMNRQMKREHQAEDVAIAKHQAKRKSGGVGQAQRAHVATELEEDQRKRSELNFDRYRQQDIENQRDNQTYWQDRINAESNGWGMGRN